MPESRWTEEEDAALTALVHEFGEKSWARIAIRLHPRTGKQCRLRWIHTLTPTITIAPWSETEDEILFTQQAIHGNRWATIKNALPGRSDACIKNHCAHCCDVHIRRAK